MAILCTQLKTDFVLISTIIKAVGTAEAGEVSASPLYCRSGRGFVCASAYYHIAF